MPGINVDPAEWADLKEIISGWRADTMQAVQEGLETVAKGIQASQSSPFGEGRAIALTPGQPVIVLSMDRARVRSLIRASDDEVYIGELSQLVGGLGYKLPTQAGDEIKTTAQIYAVYRPSGAPDRTAYVYVWNERNVDAR